MGHTDLTVNEDRAQYALANAIRTAALVMTMREISEFCQDVVDQIVVDTAEMDECF